jgi:hypothetical protein
MRLVGSVKLFALILMMQFASSSANLPAIIGKWYVGVPYNTPGAIGIDAKQEKFIKTLQIVYTADRLHVCNRDISLHPLTIKALTSDQFLEIYGFLPRLIGMKALPIKDVTINHSRNFDACGDYLNPGAHLLIGRNGHIVIEVANDYFPLKRADRAERSNHAHVH